MTAIYLDFQATSPLDPRVYDVMVPWLLKPANPHATHAFGREASRAVERAREQIADLLGAEPDEILFTSGATEAANLAIRSLPLGSRVLASNIEHACVRETLKSLASRLDVAVVSADAQGLLNAEEVAELAEGRDAVIIMAVNNEIGTIQPIREIGDACRLVGAALLTDISQAVGRIPLNLSEWGTSGAWLSSHKIYGPQGIGALIWRAGSLPTPLATGGGQERGVRPGTVPTALAVGFGAACELAKREMEREAIHVTELSARFLRGVRERHPSVLVNGSLCPRVPHNLNLAFLGIDADALVASMPDLAISTGSACSAGALGTSHVLQAIGPDEVTSSSIRVGFGRVTTAADVDTAARMICDAVDALLGGTRKKVLNGASRW